MISSKIVEKKTYYNFCFSEYDGCGSRNKYNYNNDNNDNNDNNTK